MPSPTPASSPVTSTAWSGRTAATSSTRPATVRCGAPCPRSASRPCSKESWPSRRAGHHRAVRHRRRRARTPSGPPRRRGPARPTSSSRPTACTPPPSSPSWPVATCTSTARPPEQMAHAAAVVRNNGHAHPDAVYSGRGPFTADDILASRMVADPFHLLECAMTSEGGAAVVLTRADRAADLPRAAGVRARWRHRLLRPGVPAPAGVGPRRPPAPRPRRRLRRTAGGGGGVRERRTRPDDVDVCEFYDPFSFEIIRQFEAYGFCGPGEGGDYVTSGAIEPGGRHPGHHRRRHDVVQPRRRRRAAAPDGSSAGSSSCGARVPRCRSRGRRSPCAPAAAPGRCSPTSCCSGRSDRDLLRPQSGDIPLPVPGTVSAPYWEGCAPASCASSAAAPAAGRPTRPR